MCSRTLLLFGKLPQWNLHVNCHVNRTKFQSGLTFQTCLSSLRVSCRRALRPGTIFDNRKLFQSTFTWDSKWTQTAFFFFRSVYMANNSKWNLHRSEFQFARSHVKADNEVTSHQSEILSLSEISNRFEFISGLM